jgi:hypothetical protein
MQAALAAVERADAHLMQVVMANADEATYRAAYDAKSRALAYLDTFFSGVVIELAEAA